MKARLLLILIQLDVLLMVTLFGGKRNETLSAAAWVLREDGKWAGRLFVPLIDWLMTWIERDHCYTAWLVEKDFYPKD